VQDYAADYLLKAIIIPFLLDRVQEMIALWD
jgi:hypothetical protein